MRNEDKRKQKTCQEYNHFVVDRNKLTYRKSTLAVIIDEEGKILIVSNRDYKEGEWNVPGGGIEEGETAEQAILRELNEELGSDNFVIIKKSQQIYCYEWPEDLEPYLVFPNQYKKTKKLLEEFGIA